MSTCVKSTPTTDRFNTPFVDVLAFLFGLSSRGLKTLSPSTAGESGFGSATGGGILIWNMLLCLRYLWFLRSVVDSQYCNRQRYDWWKCLEERMMERCPRRKSALFSSSQVESLLRFIVLGDCVCVIELSLSLIGSLELALTLSKIRNYRMHETR